MKILKIRIRNLASLEGDTVVDFTSEPLNTAGLYAITGPTGSGKSTILDALCLALYGRTPRYDQGTTTGIQIPDAGDQRISQGDARAILRKGTGEGYAEVDFTGIDDTAYTARWMVRRARNKPEGKFQQAEWILHETETGRVMTRGKKEAEAAIERLVGLSFQQFTRSVLLAQGDFTALLKADNDEKGLLLEKLTGTEIYSSISKAVYNMHKLAKEALANFTSAMDEISIMGDVDRAEHINHLAILQERITETEKANEQIKTWISWYQRLDELTGAVDRAERAFDQAEQDKAAAAGREEILQRTDDIQPLRFLINNRNGAQDAIKRYRNELSNIIEQQQSLTRDVKQQEENKIAAQMEQERAEARFLEAGPWLTEARKLDTQLEGIQKQYEAINAKYKTGRERENELNTKHRGITDELDGLNAGLQKLESWFAENENRAHIAGQLSIILRTLKNAKENRQKYAVTEQKLGVLNNKLISQNKEIQRINKDLADIKLKREQQLDNSAQLKARIQQAEHENLDQKVNESHERLQALKEALETWKNLQEAAANLSRNQQQLEEITRKGSNDQKEKAQAESDLDQVNIALNTAEHILTQTRLQSAASVEELRGHLKEGEPCPVCGSTHHSFGREHRVDDQVVSVLANEVQSIRNKHDQHLSKVSQLNEAIRQSRKRMEELEAGQSEIKKKHQALNEQWQHHAESVMSADAIEAGPENSLTEEINRLREQLSRLRAQQDNALKDTKAIRRITDELQKLDGDAKELNTCLNDVNIDLTRVKENIRSEEERLKGLGIDMEELLAELDDYFPETDWHELWQQNPDDFENDLISWSGQWQTKVQEKTGIQEQIHTLKQAADKTQAELEAALTQLEQTSIELGQAGENRTQIGKERAAIFEGKDADRVENTLKNAQTAAQSKTEEIRKTLEKLSLALNTCEVQADQAKTELKLQTENYNQAEQSIARWLETYYRKSGTLLALEEAEYLLGHSQEWIDEERRALLDIKSKLDISRSMLEDRRMQLQNHQDQHPETPDREKLSKLMEELTGTLENLREERENIRLLLKQDDERRLRKAELLEKYKKAASDTDDKARLNDLIGSADGKKFRQIAQEYTLDALLSFANEHLKTLAPRYLLHRIEGTLGMQVSDLDMGQEVRSVYSLSGGESFLVSLALALALASLSSNRIRVESLFIDEGFGSLDANTLSMAMDALERLPEQGRKVGVISHVQEMTERIPVQIHVKLLSTGRSKVEVLNRWTM